MRAYLAEVQRKASEQVDVDAAYVIRRLKVEAEREGPGSAHAARVSALNLLGKAMGMFQEEQHLERPILIVTDVNQLPGTSDGPPVDHRPSRPALRVGDIGGLRGSAN